ncbi:unnamed protein product [Amoebophrya sp. A120]|nr:unnamed protein product [Amoebophrya sp. A120]|eukprot:GSA120T00009687001.1
MIPCTSGNAFVNGYSIRNSEDITQVRQSIALCPQYNPMWEVYTLQQHVEFFARLRGISDADIEPTIDKYAALLGLSDKLDTLCAQLSGGQKRRLWVMCALLGHAPVVILDEPTSGMDPQARRDFWVLLKKIAKEEGRCILFSTHYLEEADLLADRKAILAAGKLAAIGTSQQLKREFGNGFWIQAVVDKAKCHDRTLARKILGEDLKKVVENCLTEDHLQVQTGSLEGRRGVEAVKHSLGTRPTVETKNPKVSDFYLAYNISWAQMHKMGDILDQLNQHVQQSPHLRDLGIEFSVEQTTLEEVFSLAGEKAELEVLKLEAAAEEKTGSTSSEQVHKSVEEQLEAKKLQKKKDEFLSKQPLRKRTLAFFQQVAAIYRFRVCGELWKKFGSYMSIGIFLTAFLVLSYQVKPEVDKDLPGMWVSIFSLWLSSIMVATLPFQLFGMNLTRNIYDKENKEGLLRHLTMHGMKRSAFHFGSFLSFFTFPTGFAWVLYTIFLMMIFSSVFASSTAIGTVFVFLFAFVVPVTNILLPMFLGLTCSNALWVIYIVVSYAVAFLPQMIYGIVRGTSNQEMWNPTFDCRMTEMFLSSHAQAAGLDMLFSFGVPDWFNAIWFVLGLFFPPVAASRAFTALYKLWTYDKAQAVIHFATSVRENYVQLQGMGLTASEIQSLLGRRAQRGLIDPHLIKKLFPYVQPTNSVFYYLFGGPAFVVEGGDVTSDGSPKLFPQYLDNPQCGRAYLTKTAWFEVLAPVWALLVIVTCFVLHQTWWLRRKTFRQFANRGLAGDQLELPAKEPEEKRDRDVVAEEKRARGGQGHQVDAVDVRDVYKHFNDVGTTTPNWATKGVTLGVPVGECFGLLGPNGAGKTTLFNLMSGNDEIGGPDSGSIFIQNKDTKTDCFASSREIMGLAPQFDKLWPHISGRMHLRLFAKCCGTYYAPKEVVVGGGRGGTSAKKAPDGSTENFEDPEAQRLLPSTINAGRTHNAYPLTDYGEERISRFLREVSLSEKDADRKVEEYSGGMKRKLSVALTLITDPGLVYLDEMSAGVDIVAQRSLWNKILHRPDGQTIITTTHSMAEADAVSDRVGVLVAGRLKCLGETSHIKKMYGSGYHLELTVDLGKQEPVVSTDARARPGATAAGAAMCNIENITADNVEQVVIQSLSQHLQVQEHADVNTAGLLEAGGATADTTTTSIAAKTPAGTERQQSYFKLLEKLSFSPTRIRLVLSFEKTDRIKISEVFRWVVRDQLNIIEDYGLGEPTLEQVFLTFAKEQEEADAERDLQEALGGGQHYLAGGAVAAPGGGAGVMYRNPFNNQVTTERVVFDHAGRQQYYDIATNMWYNQQTQQWVPAA